MSKYERKGHVTCTIDENTPIGTYFNLHPPYEHYKFGYVIASKFSKDQRPQKTIRFCGSIPVGIALARYILCVERGYDLKEDERVSYKDGDVYNYARDNIHITLIPGSWDIPIQENPENNSRFKPEPPFDSYKMGYVNEGKFFGQIRRTVKIFNQGDRKPIQLKCARYMKIVDHYRKTGEHIKDPDKHVHHINENPMDDRYDNLEWQDAKLHHRHHLNQILQRKIIKPALCCPICMTLFEKECSEQPGPVPLCCCLICYFELTRRYPVADNIDYLKDLALKQRVLVKTDANFLNFDLAQLLKDNNLAPVV